MQNDRHHRRKNKGVDKNWDMSELYDRTIFYNPSNKYCIISVKTSDQSIPQQARKRIHATGIG